MRETTVEVTVCGFHGCAPCACTLSQCKRCGAPIDRHQVEAELRERVGDIPETCRRAAEASVYCGLMCALEDFVSTFEWGGVSRRFRSNA